MNTKLVLSMAVACGALAVSKGASAYDTIYAGQVLYPGQSLVASGCYSHLDMQTDGNLVIYDGNTPNWSTNTHGINGGYAYMQADGNFVLYDWNGVARWHTNTTYNYWSRLIMQNDGNLVLYRSDNYPLWWSNTAGDEIGQSPCLRESVSTYVTTGYDRIGGDYRSILLSTSNPHVCGKYCAADPNNCKAWTFVPGSRMCWLKNIVNSQVSAPGLTSGRIMRD